MNYGGVTGSRSLSSFKTISTIGTCCFQEKRALVHGIPKGQRDCVDTKSQGSGPIMLGLVLDDGDSCNGLRIPEAVSVNDTQTSIYHR